MVTNCTIFTIRILLYVYFVMIQGNPFITAKCTIPSVGFIGNIGILTTNQLRKAEDITGNTKFLASGGIQHLSEPNHKLIYASRKMSQIYNSLTKMV